MSHYLFKASRDGSRVSPKFWIGKSRPRAVHYGTLSRPITVPMKGKELYETQKETYQLR